jgi:hypothetical protein
VTRGLAFGAWWDAGHTGVTWIGVLARFVGSETEELVQFMYEEVQDAKSHHSTGLIRYGFEVSRRFKLCTASG